MSEFLWTLLGVVIGSLGPTVAIVAWTWISAERDIRRIGRHYENLRREAMERRD